MEKGKRIAYIRTQFSFNLKAGGSVGHTQGMIRGFENAGCAVKVFSNDRLLGLDDKTVLIKPKFKKPLGELFYNIYSCRRYRSLIKEYGPDVIYHRYRGLTYFVVRLAREMGIPLILEFNSFDSWKIKHWSVNIGIIKQICRNTVKYGIVKIIERYNLKNADMIVTVSEVLRKDLIDMGIPEKKILVVPNGVDTAKFSPENTDPEKIRRLKEKLGIENGCIVAGFTGTFGPWHGIPQLTEAIETISKNRLSGKVHFLIIGDGDLKKDMVKKLQSYDKVTFTGEIPYTEITDYLAVCDILMSPHNPHPDGREFFGSPTKLFEYMAMGKGIVASRLGQIGDVLEDNETALLVEPGNVEELVRGILRLAEDAGLRERLGKRAREIAISKYTWDGNAKKILGGMKQYGFRHI
ncbi:MAG: glycosyltransferase family 4 protein [Elusimicrobia bacterium]|nr:glycosyltransferase family 4 protein [Elusimicrobiota bacterium]